MSQTAKTAPSIYILVFDSDDRFSDILRAIEFDGWAREVVGEFQTTGTGRVYAAIVVDQASQPTHICRLVRRQLAALDRRSVGVSDIEELNSENRAAIKKAIHEAMVGRRRELPIRQLGRLTPSENQRLIGQLDSTSRALADLLRTKGQADDRILAAYNDREREIIGLERDAVGLAFEIAFDNRERIAVAGAARKHSSFLSMLGTESLTEDEIILHEKDRFPGLKRLAGASPKETHFEQNGSVLRVIHANRTPLEQTLGVDLIYVSDPFRSFVGVQYKITKGASDNDSFVPESGFKKQLDTMHGVWAQLRDREAPKKQLDYRLNTIPFYFKFVSRVETNFADDKLCNGMYLPFDLVSQIRQAKPPQMIGRRHGTRHLSNTEFAILVRQGWIGANSSQAKFIEQIAKQSLRNKRSVIVGIQGQSARA